MCRLYLNTLKIAQLTFYLLHIFCIQALGFEGRSILLIGLDGLHHDIFQLANMANLRKLVTTGVKVKRVKPPSPPHSWPTQQTLVTGLYPESHGIVSNEFWDPDLLLRFSYSTTPDHFLNFWQKEGVEPIWLTNENQGGVSAVFSWVGVEAYKRPTYIARRPFRGWIPFFSLREKVDEVIRYFIYNLNQIILNLRSSKPPTFSALYWDHPDWCGHEYGPNSPEMVYTMERTDKEAFGYLLKILERYQLLEKVNVIVVADHGMKRAENIPIIGLNNYIDRYSYFLTDAKAYGGVWPYEGKKDEVFKNLSKAAPFLKVYKKEDAPINLHYGKSKRHAPILVIPQDGFLVDYEDGNLNLPGTHVFSADDPDMHTIFVASGPSFKSGVVVDHISSVDIYPLMTHILGIKPNKHNGSLDLLKQVLKEEYIDRSAGQIGHAIAYIRPDVNQSFMYGIAGNIYLNRMVKNDGSPTVHIRMNLYHAMEHQRYKMTLCTYGGPHSHGCSNNGEVFKFFDIPQADGSLQSTIQGTKERSVNISFEQSDLKLQGTSSVIGRMIRVEKLSEGNKSVSCGVILPINPDRKKHQVN